MRIDMDSGSPVLEMEPLDAKKIHDVVSQSRDRIGLLQREIKAIEQTIREVEFVRTIHEQLPMSWSTRDPGYKKPAYWFLREKDGEYERVVVKEFLSDDWEVFNGTDLEWAKILDNLQSDEPLDRVPHYLSVLPFEDVAKVKCPICSSLHQLVEVYKRVENGKKDIWVRQYVVICYGDIFCISQRFENYRFS